jgi:hypothetical protein
MNNSERIEEIFYEAYTAGDIDTLRQYIDEYKITLPHKSQNEIIELAHFKVKTDRM